MVACPSVACLESRSLYVDGLTLLDSVNHCNGTLCVICLEVCGKGLLVANDDPINFKSGGG
jgi:hypothetical protein